MEGVGIDVVLWKRRCGALWGDGLQSGCLHVRQIRGEEGEGFWMFETKERRDEGLIDSMRGFRHSTAARMLMEAAGDTGKPQVF